MNHSTLKRFRQGDKTAFTTLVERFQKPLFSYLGKMGLSQAIAEEVAQETFIRAWQAREQFNPERAAISTWLFTIARRLAINEFQRAAYRYESTNHKHSNKYDESTDEDEAAPSEHFELAEQQQLLQQALQTLDTQDRSLLALAYSKELEFSAIAEIEDIPVGTVKSRLYRIRQHLKATLNAGENHE